MLLTDQWLHCWAHLRGIHCCTHHAGCDEKMFPAGICIKWQPKIQEMIPSYGISLAQNPELFRQIQASTGETLGLNR